MTGTSPHELRAPSRRSRRRCGPRRLQAVTTAPNRMRAARMRSGRGRRSPHWVPTVCNRGVQRLRRRPRCLDEPLGRAPWSPAELQFPYELPVPSESRSSTGGCRRWPHAGVPQCVVDWALAAGGRRRRGAASSMACPAWALGGMPKASGTAWRKRASSAAVAGEAWPRAFGTALVSPLGDAGAAHSGSGEGGRGHGWMCSRTLESEPCQGDRAARVARVGPGTSW